MSFEVKHLSVSQVNKYERCPHAYFLTKVKKAWEKPAAWTVQGLAVHKAIEEFEKSGRQLSEEKVLEVYRDEFVKQFNRLAEETPNLNYWFGSGPRYPAEQDLPRRFQKGIKQVQRYIEYTANTPHERIWETPDGTPAVELPFEIDLEGVSVKGYIDQVVWDEKKGGVVVRDIKTGKQPGDDFQLGTYGAALLILFGTIVETGDYWMGESGKPTLPYPLQYWTLERLTEKFHDVFNKVRAGDFPPVPSFEKCLFCPVANSCKYAMA